MAKSKQLQLDSSSIDWNAAIKPLLKQYKGKKHPLDYKSNYQLLVMTILSARDSDRHINQVAPKLFEVYPSMKELATAATEDLFAYISGVVNFANKASWLVSIAQSVKDDKNIPTALETLIKLPGIGRKSANVILREMGKQAEGVIVDLHVLRVSPRLGIAQGTNPEKIEKQIMEKIQKKNWGDIGMCISFLGREICRPTNPKCEMCVMNTVCAYYST
ncbi:MAG: endonuclease III [Bacteroidota bacterium]